MSFSICPNLPPGLFLFDLPQPRSGFKQFISSWFFTDSIGRRILVDPGPANTIPLLLEQLNAVADGIDVVLLTHIHLDHSGGLGQFCSAYPNASVIAHKKALRHLADPSRLWSASLDTLGDIALMYQKPIPVEAALISSYDDAGKIEIFETPGHATHHLSFRAVSSSGRRLFFAGEAAGLTLPVKDGLWLRPTTPPKFDADAAFDSIDKICDILAGDELLCYAHWGAAEDPVARVNMAKEQLKKWMDFISSMTDKTSDYIASRLMEAQLASCSPDDDLTERERIFMTNSVEGILGFLKKA